MGAKIALVTVDNGDTGAGESDSFAFTPALATSQPQCEFTETIPTSPIIIHTADEGFICPVKYRWRIFAQ